MDSSLIEVVDLSANAERTSSTKSEPVLTGIELLMNSRAKTPTPDSSKSQTVADALEEDLNSLTNSGTTLPAEKPKSSGDTLQPVTLTVSKENSSSGQNSTIDLVDSTSPNKDEPIKIALGSQSAGAASGNSTWDGYSSASGAPVAATTPTLSKQDILRDKFSVLRKLEALERKGQKLTKHYTMESSLEEMNGEYEMIVSEKEKEASVRFQAKMLMACVTGITFLNQRFDPFDVNLEGWDETVQENISDYDDVFAELHEKYRSKAKIAPELKLLFMLGGSAVMAHMSNTMFKSAVPGMDDLLRDNPDLMRQFTAAAANTMSASNPGLAGFMGEFGPGMGDLPSAPQRTPKARPDLEIRTASQNPRNEGVRIDNQEASVATSSANRTPRVRPEMNGPRDVTDIVARLKRTSQHNGANEQSEDASSRISVERAASLAANASARTPNKSKRRNGGNSERSVNLTISS